MLEETTADWRTKRRATATADIVEAAWELAREHGLSGLSLRDLARRLGMAAPSLYSYVDSKNALYDAMFADGYRAFLAMDPPATSGDVRTLLRSGCELWVRFALEDPVRFQLLNQRVIPGFEPSPAAYALAQEAYERTAGVLRALPGVTQDDLDLVSAFVGGLINQQLSNDPGGDRWVRLLDDVVDLLLPRFTGTSRKPAPTRGRSGKKQESP